MPTRGRPRQFVCRIVRFPSGSMGMRPGSIRISGHEKRAPASDHSSANACVFFFVGREDGGQILNRGARPPRCVRLRVQKLPEMDQETPHNCVPGWYANRPWHQNRPDLDAQRIVIVKLNGHPEKPGRFLGWLGGIACFQRRMLVVWAFN